MAGVVRAENPVDELTAYEWATEARFPGSVQVDPESVSLSLEDVGGFWERTARRTWDLGADLTRCLRELDELRAAPADEALGHTDAVEPQPASYDRPDAASA